MTPEREELLRRHGATIDEREGVVRKDGHFLLTLSYPGQSTGLFVREEARRQWLSTLRPLAAKAQAVRMFGDPAGPSARLEAAGIWSEFFAEAARWLPPFTTPSRVGEERFEVDKEALLTDEGTEFWLWCVGTMRRSSLRPVFIVSRTDVEESTLFRDGTDPHILLHPERNIPKTLVKFVRKSAADDDHAAIVVRWAEDTHQLSLFGAPGAIGPLYRQALRESTFGKVFLESLEVRSRA